MVSGSVLRTNTDVVGAAVSLFDENGISVAFLAVSPSILMVECSSLCLYDFASLPKEKKKVLIPVVRHSETLVKLYLSPCWYEI